MSLAVSPSCIGTDYDGNPEGGAYIRDFWARLQQQPQQAWPYYARNANWDQAGEMFVDMVRHPRCDRALASWLFWSSDPRYFIEQGKRPHAETLIGAILDRSEKDGFNKAGLYYHRVEVALRALRAARRAHKSGRTAAVSHSRELCIGLGLVILSALALIFLLFSKMGC